MQYRALGRTGLKVSEIGFGTWGISGHEWIGSNDAQAMRSLQRAFDQGVNFYDTALAYGDGHSERLVGQFANHVGKDKVIIATKIPPKNRQWPAACGVSHEDVFSPAYIRTCTEQSLKNLKVDCIDLLQLHVWQDHWLEFTDWQEELFKLKAEGKCKFIGVSINDHDPTSALLLAQHKIADVIQVIYNIFDPTAEDALFGLVEEKNVGIIARVPFDEGALTGSIHRGTTFPSGDFRNLYFKESRLLEVEQKVESLSRLLGGEALSLAELALRFCLSSPLVSTVIPGMRTETNVDKNCTVSDGRKLSQSLLAQLTLHAWPKNFYDALH